MSDNGPLLRLNTQAQVRTAEDARMIDHVEVAHPIPTESAGVITTTAQDEWRATIALSGDFDAANAARLRAVLDEHLDAGRRVLRIDTRDVSFLDSTAIGVIVGVHARCQNELGSLILTGVHSRTARLFQLTGLDRVLLIDSAGDDQPSRSGEAVDGSSVLD